MTSFCPNQLKKWRNQNLSGKINSQSVYIRARIQLNGQEICNSYNTVRGCSNSRCRNAHVCVVCKKEHSQQNCYLKKLTEPEGQYPEIVGSRYPVNIKQLNDESKGHPDREFVKYLMVLRMVSTQNFLIDRNFLLNAKTYNQPDDFLFQPELIESELSKGYLFGPYDSIPFSDYCKNPVGIVEGKYSGKKRLIVDMSAPHENNLHPKLNELINKEEFSLSYLTIDNAISIIKELGKGAFCAK